MALAAVTIPERIRLDEKFAAIREPWQPRIAGELNGQHLKLARIAGAFIWHAHEEEDELFLVHRGRFRMEFRERTVELVAGDVIIVPRGVEHRPVTYDGEEAEIVLFEPAGTRNTGNIDHARTVHAPERI